MTLCLQSNKPDSRHLVLESVRTYTALLAEGRGTATLPNAVGPGVAAHSTHNTHVHTHHTYTHTRYTSHAHNTHIYVSRTYTHNTHACTQAHITHNTHGHTYTHRTDIMHTDAQQTHTHYTTNIPHTNIYVTQSHAHNIHVYTHARTHMPIGRTTCVRAHTLTATPSSG